LSKKKQDPILHRDEEKGLGFFGTGQVEAVYITLSIEKNKPIIQFKDNGLPKI
jgi:hypothetical protein